MNRESRIAAMIWGSYRLQFVEGQTAAAAGRQLGLGAEAALKNKNRVVAAVLEKMGLPCDAAGLAQLHRAAESEK